MQNGIVETEKPKVFSILLTNRGMQYYFDHLQNNRFNFECVCDAIRKRFLAEEHTRALLRELDSITLQSVIKNNSEM